MKASDYLGKFDLDLPYLKMLEIYSLTKRQTFQEVLFQIAKAGYDAEWSVISARDLGACHLREELDRCLHQRLWIIYSKRITRMIKRNKLNSQKGRTKLANLREAVIPETVELFNRLQKHPLPTPTAAEHKATAKVWKTNLETCFPQ